jgi:1,4-alpha-glucan branching enzyme
MKKYILLLLIVLTTSLIQSQVSTAPAIVLANQSAVITFNKAGTTSLSSYTGILYAHIGVTVNGSRWQNVKGTWGVNTTQPALTPSGSNYTLSISPDLYTYFGVSPANSITEICVVFRTEDGLEQSVDTFIPVGAFQYNLTAPVLNSYTFLTSGSNLLITANNTNGTATYKLFANGSTTPLNQQTTANYSYTHTGIISNQVYQLQITQGTTTFTAKFTVVIVPTGFNSTIPTGLEDGINYNATDPTKATLVLNAPLKDFIYVAGSFNNWQPTSTYVMKKDPSTGKFWLELTGLTSGTAYTYQYWVCDQLNRPANSPALVKTADPFSTLVLSPFDDSEIVTLGIYPGLPTYPVGQEREVSILQTGQTPYAWSAATTNFVKPKKKDLVIYETLIRDFAANKTYQDLIDKIDYFKNLKINAIQLMPVMEFEGNLSWGYNTVFHMAPDKRYGPPAKLKEFIDLCHQNGIAVILDIALNHVFGRSPLERMWMLDTDGDGWANGTGFRTSTENPYINQTATHAYGVGSDMNHFGTGPALNVTKNYVTKTIKTWIQDYKIDGFRWDLTKGFTNQCTSGDETCTNGYRNDRVAKLQEYADIQWQYDPNFYVIFEHLGNGGSAAEESGWADYGRISTDTNYKGIMLWRKMTDPYANLLKGNYADLSGVTDAVGSANTKYRFIGYAESHDEERTVYKAITETGQTQGNLFKAHQRLSAMGALHLLVPGPKMIWQFGELGWEKSLWTCNNGTVSYSAPDCKLDTKPIPQWTENWLTDANRLAVYNNWAKMINLKKSEDVFENGDFSWNLTATGSPRLDIWTSTVASATLSYVFVRTNFSDAALTTSANFPYPGRWYNLMDNSFIDLTDTAMNIAIEPGGFRVYGNEPTILSVNDFELSKSISISPNPASTYFTLNGDVQSVQIYSITGQLVKSFKSNFTNESQFEISDLNKGIYLVKAFDINNREATLKLVKQ